MLTVTYRFYHRCQNGIVVTTYCAIPEAAHFRLALVELCGAGLRGHGEGGHLRQVDARIGASVLCPGLIDTQIMFAYRNRPAHLLNAQNELASSREVARGERIHNLAEELGMPPAELAARVVDGIRTQQFYILTHDQFDPIIRTRMEDIVQGRNPSDPFQERPQLGENLRRAIREG